MVHLIHFSTGLFDIAKETPNPINPIPGQSVLQWLRGKLEGTPYTAGEPDAEDWGWYIGVTGNGASYLVGASGEPNESSGMVAESGGEVAIRKTAADEPFEVAGVVDDDGAFRRQQLGDDLAEVPGVGTEDDRRTVGARFEHVLAAATAEAAADESDVGQAPAWGELAEGVEEQDGVVAKKGTGVFSARTVRFQTGAWRAEKTPVPFFGV